jgi:hypothetical protein
MMLPARRALTMAVVVAVVTLPAPFLASACGGDSGGSDPGGSAAPVTAVSSRAPAPLPSALTEEWVNYAYGFSFKHPDGLLVYDDADFIERDDAVFALALEPDSEMRSAYGLGEEHDVQLRILVRPVNPFYKDLDSEGTAQQMTTDLQDDLSALAGLDASSVVPVDIDGFVGGQIAYSYDTDAGRRDTWRLTLTSPFIDYQLDIEAESPADLADRLEPVWTEIVNSLKTEQ